MNNFGRELPKELYCDFFFIIPLAVLEKLFERFSNFSSGDHLVQWNGLSNFGKGFPKSISKSVHWFSRKSRLKLFFLFIALAVNLFYRAERLEQFWKRVT